MGRGEAPFLQSAPTPQKGRVVMLVGIPGSGKSTWAAPLIERGYKVISTDQIRKSINKSLAASHATEEVQKKTNAITFARYHAQIARALKRGESVVADATHLYASARSRVREIAKRAGAEVHVVVFCDTERAVKQNKMRDADAIVPDEVMEKMISWHHETLELIDQEGYASVVRV